MLQMAPPNHIQPQSKASGAVQNENKVKMEI